MKLHKVNATIQCSPNCNVNVDQITGETAVDLTKLGCIARSNVVFILKLMESHTVYLFN